MNQNETVERHWSGDVPRAAIEALPAPAEKQVAGLSFLYGRFGSASSWQSFADSLAGAAQGREALSLEPDWSREDVVYVGYDGATQRLELAPVDGGGESDSASRTFSALPSRRRDGPDGPCSLVLLVVAREDAARTVLEYRAHTGETSSLGPVDDDRSNDEG